MLILATATIAIPDDPRQPQERKGAPVTTCCGPDHGRTGRNHPRGHAAKGSGISRFPDAVPLPLAVDQALDKSLEEVLEEAKQTVERFNAMRLGSDLFLGLDVYTDDRLVRHLGGLASGLARLIAGLETDTGETGRERLSDLSVDRRRDGLRLFLITRRLSLLLEARRRCGLRDLGLFLAAIESLALEFEAGDETLAATEPYFFFFEDRLPNIVPRQGGWLHLAGAGRWREDVPPVALTDPDREEALANLEVYRPGDGDTIAVRFPREWIAGNTGRCLSLQVNSVPVSGPREASAAAAYTGIPVCIPQSFATRFRIAGFLEYRTPTQTRVLGFQSLLFENASCTERKPVTGSLEWELVAGGRLTDTGESPLYEAGDASVSCHPEENRIVCSGHLEPAICGQAARSGDSPEETGLLLEQTEWEHIFTPTAVLPVEQVHHGWALSRRRAVDAVETRVSVPVPREGASETTTLWYELIAENGGQQQIVFVSPRQSLTAMRQSSYVKGSYRIMDELDPAPDTNAAKIRVHIEPTVCPY